jgi:methylmalonyl-CoA/ethylmalonyl-CoA epimerase
MKIDHICFAVKNLDEGINFWESTFNYCQYTRPVTNTRQKVKVVFLRKKDSLPIKLIEPLENNTGLKAFVSQGGGFHHLCFKCPELTQGIAQLREKGLRLLVPPQPGEAFDNQPIAFMLSQQNLNIELIDTDKRAAVIEDDETN